MTTTRQPILERRQAKAVKAAQRTLDGINWERFWRKIIDKMIERERLRREKRYASHP